MKRHPTHTQVKRFAFLLLAGLAFTLPARAQYTSTHPQVNVAGDFNGFETLNPNMTLVGNNLWQDDVTINTNAFRFKFSTPGFASNWGLNSQPHTTLPQAMTALSDQGDIIATNPPIAVVDGGVTNLVYNPIRFIFNDATREFAVFVLNNTAASNLLYNASFETAGSQATRARYWEQNNPNIHGAMLGTAERQNWANPAKSGSWVGLIKGRWANQGNSGSWWQEAPVEPGVTYEASAWFQPEDTPNLWTAAVHQLKLEYWDFNRTTKLAEFIEDISEIPNSNTNWVPQFVSGTAPANAAWGRLTVFVDGVGPSGTFRIDDAELRIINPKRAEDFNDWTGASIISTYSIGGWLINSGRTVSTYIFDGQPVQLARSGNAASLANAGATTNGGFVQTPLFADGAGSISFYYRHGYAGDPEDAPTAPVAFRVEESLSGDFWTTIATVSNILNTTYQRFNLFQELPGPRTVRIVHNGGSTNHLLIDDLAIAIPTSGTRLMDFEGWNPASDKYLGWRINTGFVSSAIALGQQAGQLPGNATDSNAIISPEFTNGYGSITFNYRRGLNGPRTVGLRLEASTNNFVTFTELARITNIYELSWQTFNKFFIATTPHAIRIRNIAETNIAPNATEVLREPFDAGATPPPGWTFTSIGQYTTTGSSGQNPPSIQFNSTGSQAITPIFSNGTNVSFMTKGNTISAQSSFLVEGLTGSTWAVLATYSNMNDTKITRTLGISTNVTQLRFTYTKVAGNLAFDDLLINGLPGGDTSMRQNLVIDNFEVADPQEYRRQDFNTWPAKGSYDIGTTFHEGWTLEGPTKVGPEKPVTGNALTLARIPADGGGGGGDSVDYQTGFENAAKTSYASGTVNLDGINWDMTEALIGNSDADWKVGAKSARMRGYATSSMTMLADKSGGLGTLSFSYRRYGTDAQASWQVQISTDSGANWINAGAAFTAPASDVVQNFSYTGNIEGNVRVRIICTSSGSSNRRLNIDNITLTGYVPSEGGGEAIGSSLTSHPMSGGLGAIRFSYRHALETTPLPSNSVLTAAIQTSADGINWTHRTNLVINNKTYASFEYFNSITTQFYARIIITNGFGEALIDDVEILRPQPAATVTLVGSTFPQNPFTNDFVNLRASASPLYGAGNISVTSYYRIGTSGAFTAVAMNPVGGNQFEAATNIPPQPKGTIVQYYMAAWFTGPGASPPVYYPLGGSNSPAFYGIPRNQPGQVWINELDVNAWTYTYATTNLLGYEFVELAGLAGADLEGWSFEFYDGASPTLIATLTINDFVFEAETNGYGFFVLASSGISEPPRDMLISNGPSPEWPDIIMSLSYTEGAIRLLNEFGGVEDQASYNISVSGFDRIPTDDSGDFLETNGIFYVSTTNAFSKIGTGTLGTEFDWATNLVYPTPGEVNIGQTFGNPAIIDASPSSLAYEYIRGSISPSPQSIIVSNAGTGEAVLEYTINSSASWLTVSPASGSLTSGQFAVLSVSVDTSVMQGNQLGSLIISGNAINSRSISITVTEVLLGNALVHLTFDNALDNKIINDSAATLGDAASVFMTNGARRTANAFGVSGEVGDYGYQSDTNTARALSAGVVNGLTNLSQFTLAGWIKPTGTGDTPRVIIGNQSFGLQAQPVSNSYTELRLLAGGTNAIVSTNRIVATNAWTFFAVTFNGSVSNEAVKFFTGSISEKAAMTSVHNRATGMIGTGASASVLRVGGDGTNSIPGLLDDLRIYGSVLDLSSIEKIRASSAIRGTGEGFAPFIEGELVSAIYTPSSFGNSHDFFIDYQGVPAPTFTWRRNGSPIPGAPDNALYSFNMSDLSVAGLYDVVLSNKSGSVTSRVADLVFITNLPVDVFAYSNDTVRFSIGVTPGISRFQWYSNNVAIAGATNPFYQITNYKTATSAWYHVMVTNSPAFFTSSWVRAYLTTLEFAPTGGAQGIAKPGTSTNVVVSWPSITNRMYDILWSTNLMAGETNFVVIATNRPGTPPFNIYTDSVHGAKSHGFYRIRSTQQ